jgi:hypothetical protein
MLHKVDHIVVSSLKLDQRGKADSGRILPFNKGEILQGRVLKSISPRHAILLLGDQQVTARTSVPLRAGQMAFFRVEQVGPHCVLRVVEPPVGDVDAVSRLLTRSALRESPYKNLIKLLAPFMRSGEGAAVSKGPNILAQLGEMLGRVSFSSEQVLGGGFLKSFIDGSGMIWEHKLRSLLLSGFKGASNLEALIEQDLKGLALKTLSDGAASKLVPAEVISRFVDSLEQFQLLNASRLEGEGKLFFTFPLELHGEFYFGELLIELPKEGEGEGTDRDKVLRASLLLQMSRLGPVRADVTVFQKTIRVGFLVCEEEVQSLFDDHKGLLKGQLESHGFRVNEVTCRLQEADVLAQASLVEEILDSEEHQINLIV